MSVKAGIIFNLLFSDIIKPKKMTNTHTHTHTNHLPSMNKNEDVPMVEFMYLVFTCMPVESYNR